VTKGEANTAGLIIWLAYFIAGSEAYSNQDLIFIASFKQRQLQQ
jgi:hypothetical protein